MDLWTDLAAIMDREQSASPATSESQDSQENNPDTDQSQPGKAKPVKKNKGVNWYTHLPKGPPPKMTPEQLQKSMDTKQQLRNFIIAKREKMANQMMLNYSEPNPTPQPHLYNFHTMVPVVYAGIPAPFFATSFSPTPITPKQELFPPPDPSLSPLHVFHGKGEIAKAVDYSTCTPDCWCGPPTSQK